MTDSVQRWGNSPAVRMHRLARDLGLRERSGVRLRLDGGRLVIEPLPMPLTLDRLLAGTPVKLWWRWTPGRGDVVSVKTADLDRRPALVLSPAAYSARTGFAICCSMVEETAPLPSRCPLQRGCKESWRPTESCGWISGPAG
jgi:antitoxin component of MazEF toxin-antitoxin module